MKTLGYELRAALAQPTLILNPVAFALLAIMLFDLVLPDGLLHAAGPAIL